MQEEKVILVDELDNQLGLMPKMEAGDLLAFRTAGAYGAVMASNYNMRRLPAEIMVKGSKWSETRPRQSYEQLFAGEITAPWLL